MSPSHKSGRRQHEANDALASRISYRSDPLYRASLTSSGYEALIDAIGFEIIDHAVNGAPSG
jgi:hypothetical protein